MKFDFILDFLKSKKGKTVVVAIVGAAIVHFFPDSANTVAEILHGVADKVQPAVDAVQPQ